MEMDLSSLFALGLFIAIEGFILFYLKKDVEILKSNKQTFANSSPEQRIELFLYSKKDEETLELEKKLRPIMLRGDFYRLQNPYTSNYCAWEMVMKNQSEAFLMCAKRLSEANCEDKRIRLQGLDPDLDYIDTFTGNIYGGDELMYNGITPEFGSYDFATQIFYFRKVEK